jgi:DNA-binding SARP family transcriptional activator
MDFRILGPLEVRDGDREVRLPAGKQRALLALLVVNANRTLAIDRIVDDLWGEDVPESAQKMVQIHVSRLRKVLAPGLLHTRPPGYSLQLASDEIDLQRFERLVAAARRELDAGRAEEAAASFRAALELWRGPALAEFASEPFAPAEGARLEEVRISALEGRLEADLLLGRHGDLVGELEALIARYPLREGLRRQHMLALYRSGRQAEALSGYQDARRALADELGIEPSPALRELERRILQQDSSLNLGPPAAARNASAPASARTSVAAAWADTPELIGRERELGVLDDRLDRAVAGDGGLLLLAGEAGVGKTSLAKAALGASAALVLPGAGSEQGRAPYAPVIATLRAYDRVAPGALAESGRPARRSQASRVASQPWSSSMTFSGATRRLWSCCRRSRRRSRACRSSSWRSIGAVRSRARTRFVACAPSFVGARGSTSWCWSPSTRHKQPSSPRAPSVAG